MVKKISLAIVLILLSAGTYWWATQKTPLTLQPLAPSYTTTLTEPAIFVENDSLIQKLALPKLFANSMILQRDEPIFLWGVAKSGASVSISFQSFTVTTTANEKGYWTTIFPPQSTGKTGDMIVSSGIEQITLENVLVGDVWLCSGQSNMVFPIEKSAQNNKDALKSLNTTQVRFSKIPARYNLVIESSLQTNSGSETWFTADSPSFSEFSALCALTAQKLFETTQVPQGMVLNAHNSTNIESWLSRSQLAEFSDYTSAMNSIYSADHLDSPIEYVKACGQQLIPASHFNTMVFPVINMTVKGIVWYQGESNAKRSENYQKLLSKLVSEWRKNPVAEASLRSFYIVELPAYNEPGNTSSWAAIRESQASVAAMIPQTFLVPASDLGDVADIHPVDKLELSTRISRRILSNSYKTGVDLLAPQVHSITNSEKSIDITLDLKGNTLEFATGIPSGIEIAGSDEIYFMADVTKVKENVIRATSPYVNAPKWIRINWKNVVESSIKTKQSALYIQTYTNNDKNKRSTVPLQSIICK